MSRRLALGAVAVAALVLASAFVVPVGAGGAEPVPFDDTVSLGMSSESLQTAAAGDIVLPKVEAFYSEYEYVIGYYGVEAYLGEQRRTGHERQFGQPVAVFVTDFAGSGVTLTEDGYPRTPGGQEPGFAPAGETYVVVGSEARTASGPLAMPFGERAAASAFADRYGGEVVPWSRVGEAVTVESRLTRERFQGEVAERSGWADERVRDARALRERPVSVTVGEDAPTLRAALAAAPPNTTVRLPPGEYRVDGLVVDKPVTLDGAGAATVLRGDGNGTVLRVNASRAAVTDLRITGVGDVGSPHGPSNASVGWSESVDLAYGRGDAAIRLDGADGALVGNVHVETPASGVITRNATGAVVRELRLQGTDDPREGFMGVIAMYAPIVVEESRFVGGRDAVYTHRAHGTVVRGNTMLEGRFGVHLMYTSRTLIRDNAIHDQTVGVIVMTRPTGNLVVNNTATDARTGIVTFGSDSYYARNTVVDNRYGMSVAGWGSLYTYNTVVGNTYGLRGSSLLPTNHVTHNDVADNGRPVESTLGAMRVWTVDGEGNYWGQMPARDRGDGHYDRAYRPSGPVDARLHTTAGASTLARSPAVGLSLGLQDAVPGLRATGVVDTAPRTEPVRPGALAAARAMDDEGGVAG